MIKLHTHTHIYICESCTKNCEAGLRAESIGSGPDTMHDYGLTDSNHTVCKMLQSPPRGYSEASGDLNAAGAHADATNPLPL